MINYTAGTLGVAFIFRRSGSVFPKALLWGIPSAILSGFLYWFCPAAIDFDGIDTLWTAYTTVLGFLIVFKMNQAYARFSEGASVMQDVRCHWLNAVRSLVAFCDKSEEKKTEVRSFQHFLVRLVSMMHCAALQQITEVDDDHFEIIRAMGVERSKLKFLSGRREDRCDILLQWIQRVIVDHEAAGIFKIAPPFLARVFQDLSNGIIKLQDAQRIKAIPFPYPYAQLLSLLMLVFTISTPLLASQVATCSPDPAFGCQRNINHETLSMLMVMAPTFLLVTSFWALLYISLEIERPFGEDMNDLPVADMQRDMNRCLTLLLKREVQTPPRFLYYEEHEAMEISVASMSDTIVADLPAPLLSESESRFPPISESRSPPISRAITMVPDSENDTSSVTPCLSTKPPSAQNSSTTEASTRRAFVPRRPPWVGVVVGAVVGGTVVALCAGVGVICYVINLTPSNSTTTVANTTKGATEVTQIQSIVPSMGENQIWKATDPTPEPIEGHTIAKLAVGTTGARTKVMRIQSTVSAMCVDLAGGDTSNGSLLGMRDCHGGETQRWSFRNNQLVYVPDTSKCVGLLGGNSTNGNQLRLWDCDDGESQQWGFDSDAGTIYLATSAHDATKCIRIRGEKKGDPVEIWNCNGDEDQTWKVGSEFDHPSSVAV